MSENLSAVITIVVAAGFGIWCWRNDKKYREWRHKQNLKKRRKKYGG